MSEEKMKIQCVVCERAPPTMILCANKAPTVGSFFLFYLNLDTTSMCDVESF